MKQFRNKFYFLLVFLFSLVIQVSAQNGKKLWKKTVKLERNGAAKVKRKTLPKKFEVFELNSEMLKTKLRSTPKRKGVLKKSNTIIDFPNSDGELERYEVFEASIMDENLQKKHPSIKSYIGKGIDNPGSIIRLSLTSLGFHGMILEKNGNANFIDPYTKEDDSYIVYSKKNLPSIEPFQCKFDEINPKAEVSNINLVPENANDGNLRTFRLAVATTGEYSQFHLTNQNVSTGATDEEKKAVVLSAIVVTMTRVNAIFERDVALTMKLVDNNSSIIFLDAVTDGFTNDDGDLLINESQSIIDANIGFQNYDIGHTFSTGGGGLAQVNSPCTTNKARGITGSNNPIGDAYDIDYVAHEMGHQFGAHHTFNGDAGNCAPPNRNDGTAVEPGSGSTIMAYAGICSPQNVQQNSDDYFHLVSIREMWANISVGNSACAELTATNNSSPIIEPLSNYAIPVSTPFVLDVQASDSDGDNLTYTWEQLDTEINGYPLVSTFTNGPVFRSTPPTSESMRYFPNQLTVNSGDLANFWEVLPSVGRTMRFGVNVRDNSINGGQTVSDETVLTVVEGSGPFKVTSQIESSTWDAGTSQTITWDVANTNLAPINCSNVNILLSVDGGMTYPTILASNVSNNGLHEIIVPNISSNKVRVKVESVGNVFYAINKANLSIQSSEFIMNFENFEKSTCVPTSVTYNFTYNTYLGFNETTTFSATGNPVGTVVEFNPSSATENNTSVEMIVSNIDETHLGVHTISVKGTSTSVNKTTSVALNVFSSNLAEPTLLFPTNNNQSVLKPYTLSWNENINAASYIVEIATDNTFSTILESSIVSETNFFPQNLQTNSTYFWRVKAQNDCGESVFSEVNSFTTENEVCNTRTSTDVPKSIPDNSALGVNSSIAIVENKVIRDVNVNLTITHSYVGDLTLTLISPSGKSVLLSSNIGNDGSGYVNTTFDDEAVSEISLETPPYTGEFIPQGNLSDFYNEESKGQWLLKVVDAGDADIGQIENWSLEICGVPILINDDDNDGVSNEIDQCPNTPIGTYVDEAGCFALPPANFTIEVIGETCAGKENGSIEIAVQEAYNYSVTVDGTIYNFTNTTNAFIEGLAPDTYEFCISV
ncbi:reprolysin-like metallopeptidase, partial [Lutibacter aestuarii]